MWNRARKMLCNGREWECQLCVLCILPLMPKSHVLCYKWFIFAFWGYWDNNASCLINFAKCFLRIHLLSRTGCFFLLTWSVNRQCQCITCSKGVYCGIKRSLKEFRIFKEILLPLHCLAMERFQLWILTWLVFSEVGRDCLRFLR